NNASERLRRRRCMHDDVHGAHYEWNIVSEAKEMNAIGDTAFPGALAQMCCIGLFTKKHLADNQRLNFGERLQRFDQDVLSFPWRYSAEDANQRCVLHMQRRAKRRDIGLADLLKR